MPFKGVREASAKRDGGCTTGWLRHISAPAIVEDLQATVSELAKIDELDKEHLPKALLSPQRKALRSKGRKFSSQNLAFCLTHIVNNSSELD